MPTLNLGPGLFHCWGCLLCILASSLLPGAQHRNPAQTTTHTTHLHIPQACPHNIHNILMMIMVLGLLLRLGNSH